MKSGSSPIAAWAVIAHIVAAGVSHAAECQGVGGSFPDSDVPCGIVLVGTHAGVADPRGTFLVTIRDLGHNPVADCEVTLDFSGCSDLRIGTVQPDPGTLLQCVPTPEHPTPGALVSKRTDASGNATFRVVGSASHTMSGESGAGFKCMRLYAGSQLLATVNVAAFDLDGAGGVSPADLAVWLPDAFAYPGVYVSRSDYNCTNSINPADLSLLLAASFGGGSTQSVGDSCR